MVGLINELVLSFVEKNYGAGAALDVRRRAGVPAGAAYRVDTVYPDEEFQRIFAAARAQSGLGEEDFERALARYAGDYLLLRFPGFWTGASGAREMILRQPRIHQAIASSARETALRRGINDKFRVEATPDGAVVHYVSPNRLCGFYRGFAGWIAERFGEELEVDEPRCQKRGAGACEIHLRFSPRRA
jgi:hypothetical protein